MGSVTRIYYWQIVEELNGQEIKELITMLEGRLKELEEDDETS